MREWLSNGSGGTCLDPNSMNECQRPVRLSGPLIRALASIARTTRSLPCATASNSPISTETSVPGHPWKATSSLVQQRLQPSDGIRHQHCTRRDHLVRTVYGSPMIAIHPNMMTQAQEGMCLARH